MKVFRISWKPGCESCRKELFRRFRSSTSSASPPAESTCCLVPGLMLPPAAQSENCSSDGGTKSNRRLHRKSDNNDHDNYDANINPADQLTDTCPPYPQPHLLIMSPHCCFPVSSPLSLTWRLLPPAGYPGFQTATYTSRSYAGITPGYTYQFPGNHSSLPVPSHGVTWQI